MVGYQKMIKKTAGLCRHLAQVVPKGHEQAFQTHLFQSPHTESGKTIVAFQLTKYGFYFYGTLTSVRFACGALK
jgi:hypothetical protein